MTRVYISCPISVPEATLRKVEDHIDCQAGFISSYWERGSTYTDTALKTADAVVFMFPNNNFSTYLDHLPSGVKKELKLAVKLCKPIFVAYRKVDDTIGIYDMEICDNNFISAIKGTCDNTFNINFETGQVKPPACSAPVKEDSIQQYSVDNRVLLMLK